MKWLPSIVAAIALAHGARAASGYTPTREELLDFGIIVTNCVRDTRGISIGWVTAHDGPFHVGVYPAYDWSDLGYLKEVVTSAGSAFVPGDFTDMPVWVKVVTAGRVAEVNEAGTTNFHRRLTKDEVAPFAAECSLPPAPDRRDDVRLRGDLGSIRMAFDATLSVSRYFSVAYDGITYTNTASAATTTIRLGPSAVPSAVAGEEAIRYWPVSTYSGTNYNPAANNSWYMWSSNSAAPQFLTYKGGPTYWIKPEVTTNDEMGVVHEVEAPAAPELLLTKGTVLSRSTVAGPTLAIIRGATYRFVAVTNTFRHYEYNSGWTLHPLNPPAPGREIVWHAPCHGTNTSNAVYLPRLFKGVPGNGARRATTDIYGRAIVVTNAPSHWERDFGVADVPPGSNALFRINFTEGE